MGCLVVGDGDFTRWPDANHQASGRSFRDFHYALVFATFSRGAVQIKVMRQMRAQGTDIPDALFVDNFPVRTLRRLLGLNSAG